MRSDVRAVHHTHIHAAPRDPATHPHASADCTVLAVFAVSACLQAKFSSVQLTSAQCRSFISSLVQFSLIAKWLGSFSVSLRRVSASSG